MTTALWRKKAFVWFVNSFEGQYNSKNFLFKIWKDGALISKENKKQNVGTLHKNKEIVPCYLTWTFNWNSSNEVDHSFFVAAVFGKSWNLQVIIKPLSSALFLSWFIYG